MILFGKEWLDNIPKIVNANGCWIPTRLSVDKDGYSRITKCGKNYRLARLVMSIYYNIDYYDSTVETRHNKGCDKSCFYPEHLKPGSHTDNMRDKTEHGTHHNLNKQKCTTCGGEYTVIIRKSGVRKGMKFRRCKICAKRQRLDFTKFGRKPKLIRRIT